MNTSPALAEACDAQALKNARARIAHLESVLDAIATFQCPGALDAGRTMQERRDVAWNGLCHIREEARRGLLATPDLIRPHRTASPDHLCMVAHLVCDAPLRTARRVLALHPDLAADPGEIVSRAEHRQRRAIYLRECRANGIIPIYP